MKKNGWIMILLLIMGSFSMELMAQRNLEALVKKCETMESVNMNIVRIKDPKTKKMEREIISFTICENQALVNEFVAAFKKDEEKAIRAQEQREGGRTISLFYRFEDNSTYSLSQDPKGCTMISIITRQEQEE